jgi:hypothetical protein
MKKTTKITGVSSIVLMLFICIYFDANSEGFGLCKNFEIGIKAGFCMALVALIGSIIMSMDNEFMEPSVNDRDNFSPFGRVLAFVFTSVVISIFLSPLIYDLLLLITLIALILFLPTSTIYLLWKKFNK